MRIRPAHQASGWRSLPVESGERARLRRETQPARPIDDHRERLGDRLGSRSTMIAASPVTSGSDALPTSGRAARYRLSGGNQSLHTKKGRQTALLRRARRSLRDTTREQCPRRQLGHPIALELGCRHRPHDELYIVTDAALCVARRPANPQCLSRRQRTGNRTKARRRLPRARKARSSAGVRSAKMIDTSGWRTRSGSSPNDRGRSGVFGHRDRHRRGAAGEEQPGVEASSRSRNLREFDVARLK